MRLGWLVRAAGLGDGRGLTRRQHASVEGTYSANVGIRCVETPSCQSGSAFRMGANQIKIPTRRRSEMCQHQPACPPAEASGREDALVVTAHPEQGWSLLCNGVILFDDSGELLPDGRAVAPPLAAAPRRAA